MRRFLLILALLPLMAFGQRPATINTPVQVDANGTMLPVRPYDLPANSTIGGQPIGGGGGSLPTQSGHSGEFLTTNGTAASWAAPISVQRTFFVDSVYGNDSTGALGRSDKPYLTVQAAVDALVTYLASNLSEDPYQYLIEIGNNFFDEAVTTGAEIVTFHGVNYETSRAFTSLTFTGSGDHTAILYDCNGGVGTGGVYADTTGTLYVGMQKSGVAAIHNDSGPINAFCDTVGAGEITHVVSAGGSVYIQGIHHLGGPVIASGDVTLYDCNTLDGVGYPSITATGHDVTLNNSVVQNVTCDTLTLNDSAYNGTLTVANPVVRNQLWFQSPTGDGSGLTNLYGVVLGANQSVRRNSDDTAYEAFDTSSGSGAPTDATYITSTANGTLSNEFALGSLATGILKNNTTTGIPSIASAGDFPTLNQNTSGSAATLTTARAIYGNNFDGSAALSQIIASTYGGTGNGFTKFSGPASTEKTKTLSNASDTILELGGSYTPSGTWTNMTLVTPALGTPSAIVLTNATGSPTGISLTKAQLSTIVSDDDPAYLAAANTFTAAQINSTSGAASAPAMKYSGVPFAGTGTTSFPLVYINDANATASTTLATAGTYFGINGHGTQDFMNLLHDGVSRLSVDSSGNLTGGDLRSINQNTISYYSSSLSGTNRSAVIYTDGFHVASSNTITWSSNAVNGGDAYSNQDTGFARNAAGRVEVNNGTAGTFRDIKVRTMQSAGTTYANLPTAAAGMISYITDGATGNCGDSLCTTFGTTVTGGGGSLKLLVWYNGTNWTLVGK